MAELCKVCDDIDRIVKKLETPVINPALKDRKVKQKEAGLEVLAKPRAVAVNIQSHPFRGG